MTTKELRKVAILKERLERYFKVGAVVSDYAGLDKVLAFDWNNGDWSVTVQAINKDGSIDKRWDYPRKHATMPSIKELNA